MGGGGRDVEVGAARILPRMRFAAELDELLAYAVIPRESREVARATGSAMRRTGFMVCTFRAGATGGIRMKIVSHGIAASQCKKCAQRAMANTR
jgi:hypothetical protein